jgi:hypothetical protein
VKRLVILLLLLTASCSHVHSFHQDQLDTTAGRPIEVVAEKRVWFNWNFDNDFIDDAYADFRARCPGGTIHGVSSRLSSENGFFYWYSRVRFAGTCSAAPTLEVETSTTTAAGV